MSSGEQGARVVVDLASFQPLEDGDLEQQTIHNVRLQQLCPAKRRRRFLRRAAPAQPGTPGAVPNHIHKDAILIIGWYHPWLDYPLQSNCKVKNMTRKSWTLLVAVFKYRCSSREAVDEGLRHSSQTHTSTQRM